MLTKLRARVKALGIVKVTESLGYRSVRTIQKWLNDGKIPSCAKAKVQKYLEEEAWQF